MRARLEPLASGERPGAVTVAALLALVLAVANVVALAAGLEVRGHSTAPGGVIVFSVVMLLAAGGMWRARYWAVLGFEALLAIAIGVATIVLIVAANVVGAVVCLAIILPGGLLFWKLVRAMARIQMPRMPGT